MSAKAQAVSDDLEAQVVVQALRATKLPSLVAADEHLFKELVRDTWPQVDLVDTLDSSWEVSIRTAMESLHLSFDSSQVCNMC
jgi:hypothetical protein